MLELYSYTGNFYTLPSKVWKFMASMDAFRLSTWSYRRLTASESSASLNLSYPKVNAAEIFTYNTYVSYLPVSGMGHVVMLGLNCKRFSLLKFLFGGELEPLPLRYLRKRETCKKKKADVYRRKIIVPCNTADSMLLLKVRFSVREASFVVILT